MENILTALDNALELLETGAGENTQLMRAKNRLVDVIAIVKASDDVAVDQDAPVETPDVPDTDVSNQVDTTPTSTEEGATINDANLAPASDGAELPKTEGLVQE